jgi:hypothetical protein
VLPESRQGLQLTPGDATGRGTLGVFLRLSMVCSCCMVFIGCKLLRDLSLSHGLLRSPTPSLCSSCTRHSVAAISLETMRVKWLRGLRCSLSQSRQQLHTIFSYRQQLSGQAVQDETEAAIPTDAVI